jgi:hypothetical protein
MSRVDTWRQKMEAPLAFIDRVTPEFGGLFDTSYTFQVYGDGSVGLTITTKRAYRANVMAQLNVTEEELRVARAEGSADCFFDDYGIEHFCGWVPTGPSEGFQVSVEIR